MPRKIVSLHTGETYHIYNRGVDKRDIYMSKQDYLRFYISLLYFNTIEPIRSLRDVPQTKKTEKCDKLVNIRAYCLLPNHYHILITQLVDGGISEFLKRVAGGYTLYFNKHNNRSGSLFQGTFKRSHVASEEYYQYLFTYINENHIVHKIPELRKIYTTSSLHFQGFKRSKLIHKQDIDNYRVDEAQKVAQAIYNKRNGFSDSITNIDSSVTNQGV